jgi:hypothetical protein
MHCSGASMKKKKFKKVSLPAVPSLSITLKENDPTIERLVQAGVSVAMTVQGRRTQIIGPKSARPIGADGVFRLTEAPLDRLSARGRLDEKNPDRNERLFEAGHKLRRHWYHGGLSGIGSVDLNRTGGGGTGSPAWLTPTSESAVDHRGQYRRARESMDAGAWQIVLDVVCGEITLAGAGRLAGYRNEDAANAVALDRLRRGLEALAQLWGHLPPHAANANHSEIEVSGAGEA